MFVDVEGILVHDGRGRGNALGAQPCVPVALDGVGGVGLDLGRRRASSCPAPRSPRGREWSARQPLRERQERNTEGDDEGYRPPLCSDCVLFFRHSVIEVLSGEEKRGERQCSPRFAAVSAPYGGLFLFRRVLFCLECLQVGHDVLHLFGLHVQGLALRPW